MRDPSTGDPAHSHHMSTGEIESVLAHVENALLDHDLERAAMMVARLQAGSEDMNGTLANLHDRIQKARISEETQEQLFIIGKRALEHNELETAADNFKKILKLTPDHAEARAFLQTTLRNQENQIEVVAKLDQAHDARCRGDFETARELCRDVLNISPEHDSAKQFLRNLEEFISRRRQAQILVSQGEKLFQLNEFSRAIQVWESVADIDPSFNEGRKLIREAELALYEQENSQAAESLLRKAQQYLDNGRYKAVLEILENFPEKTQFSLDASVMRKKAADGLETQDLMESLAQEVIDLIERNLPDAARTRFSMMLEVDPNASIILDIRDRFNKSGIDPA